MKATKHGTVLVVVLYTTHAQYLLINLFLENKLKIPFYVLFKEVSITLRIFDTSTSHVIQVPLRQNIYAVRCA